MKSKKAMAGVGSLLWEQWPELFFFILLVIGLIISISIQNAFLSYTIIFCVGLMAGRFIYMKIGKQPLFPFFLIAIGFLVGYVLGSVQFNRKLITFLFILGALISYYVHKKKYIK